MTDGKGLSRHQYRVAGRERVKVPAGEFDAVRVVRSDKKDAVQIWLATERWHLPVRLLEERDGTRYDQVAIRITAP